MCQFSSSESRVGPSAACAAAAADDIGGMAEAGAEFVGLNWGLTELEAADAPGSAAAPGVEPFCGVAAFASLEVDPVPDAPGTTEAMRL